MEFSGLQKIKREFFSRRNGITAEVLRKGGSPFKIIFGLMIPQLSEIASEVGKDEHLAELLWDNNSTRCSMLLAPMVMPVEKFTLEKALKWVREIPAREVSDVLCLKLLSQTEFQKELFDLLALNDGQQLDLAMRLALQQLRKHGREWESRAVKAAYHPEAEKNLFLKNQLMEEIEYLKNES